MTNNSHISPIVFGLRFLKRNWIPLIGGIALSFGMAIWGMKARTPHYRAEMVLETHCVDKNVLVEMIARIDFNKLREIEQVPEIELKAEVIDLRDRVITPQTEPSRMVRIIAKSSDEDVFLALPERIVDELRASDYYVEMAESCEKDPKKSLHVVTPFTKPVEVPGVKKLFATYFVITYLIVLALTIFLDVLVAAWKEVKKG